MMCSALRFSACALAVVLLAGCAYRLGPTNGETAGAHTVQVQPFQNKTLEPHLTDYVMGSLRKRLQEEGTYRVDTHNNGDIILSGVITAYDRTPLSYQPTDVITVVDYQIAMTAQVTARDRRTGKVIFDKQVKGRTTLRVDADETSAERSAIPLLTDDLARKAVNQLVDGSW
jgi:outer membrane lipopolysaccharide assembly protein LptE/RlpB